jgi:hypothetical protein
MLKFLWYTNFVITFEECFGIWGSLLKVNKQRKKQTHEADIDDDDDDDGDDDDNDDDDVSIKFNFFVTCLLNSPNANYKVSTGKDTTQSKKNQYNLHNLENKNSVSAITPIIK